MTQKPSLIQVKPNVRVEAGPVPMTQIATEELLSDDVTARHYQVGMVDVYGKVIELGKECTLYDWRGFRAGKTGRWNVYQFHILSEEEKKAQKTTLPGRYLHVGAYPNQIEAIQAAAKIEEEEMPDGVSV